MKLYLLELYHKISMNLDVGLIYISKLVTLLIGYYTTIITNKLIFCGLKINEFIINIYVLDILL